MTLLQIILLISLFVLLLLYLRFFSNRIFNMLFFMGLFFIGILFVINPSLSQKIAVVFGVGRGVDLIIYFLFIVFFFLFISLFYKTRNLDKTIIELIRKRAIQTATKKGKYL